MSKHSPRCDSKTALAILDALAKNGQLDRVELSVMVGATESTVKAYANDLKNAELLHIAKRVRDKYGLEVPTYAYGKGENCKPLKRLNGRGLIEAIEARNNAVPIQHIPTPDFLTRVFLRIPMEDNHV